MNEMMGWGAASNPAGQQARWLSAPAGPGRAVPRKRGLLQGKAKGSLLRRALDVC
jgi:hypothetical protein